MEKRKLKILLLVLSLIFLIMLYFISYAPPKNLLVEELSKKNIGERIQVSGEVKNIYATETGCFIRLDKGNISFFSSPCPEINKSQNIIIIGKPYLYKGEMQFSVEKIIE